MVLRERPRGGTSRRIIENDDHDGLDEPYLQVPHKNGRKANIGKTYSAQRPPAARIPPSPVNSRREGQASESSRSHHLPTPGSSRNRTPEFDEDDFDDAKMTEDSDLSRTDSDSEAENFAATNRKPAKSTTTTAATKASLGRRYTPAPASGPGDVAPKAAPMPGYSRAPVSKAKAGLNTSGSSGNAYHDRKRYETAPSEDEDDYSDSDSDSENFAQEDPAVHSDENDEEAGRRIKMQQRHIHQSTDRASFMSDQSQTAAHEVNRWPSKKARSAAEKSETTAPRKPKSIPRGVTDTASKADKDVFTRQDTAKANPQLEIKSCIGCLDDIPPQQIIKLDCGDYICHHCLKQHFRDSVKNSAQFPPQCCEINIPLKLISEHLDSSFKKAFDRRLAQYNKSQASSRRPLQPDEDGEDDDSFDIDARPPSVSASAPGYHGYSAPYSSTKRSSRRHNKDRARDRDEIGSARTAPTPRREATKINGWQRCYNCDAVVEQREGSSFITCRCGAEFCTTCGTKWKDCDCHLASFDPLLNSTNSEFAGGGSEPLPDDEMAYNIQPRLIRGDRVSGRMSVGAPPGPSSEYYARNVAREAPREYHDDYDVGYGAPVKPRDRDFASERAATREPSAGLGRERMFAGRERERERAGFARDRERAAAAAADYPEDYMDYNAEYPDDYDAEYGDLPAGGSAGNMGGFRQEFRSREPSAPAAADYADPRVHPSRQTRTRPGARAATDAGYDDAYPEEYAGASAAIGGKYSASERYPDDYGQDGYAAAPARYAASAKFERPSAKYAADAYANRLSDSFEDDDYRSEPVARPPTGYNRRATADFADDGLPEARDPRDMRRERASRDVRPPRAASRPRHSSAAHMYEEEHERLPRHISGARGNELVLGHSKASRSHEEEIDEDSEYEDFLGPPQPPAARQRGSGGGFGRGGRAPATAPEDDEDYYEEYPRATHSMPPGGVSQRASVHGAAPFERHSTTGEFPKTRRRANSTERRLMGRLKNRNSVPPSPRTAPPYGGHGPHAGAPPHMNGPMPPGPMGAMMPGPGLMRGPIGGPIGGPMGGGPMAHAGPMVSLGGPVPGPMPAMGSIGPMGVPGGPMPPHGHGPGPGPGPGPLALYGNRPPPHMLPPLAPGPPMMHPPFDKGMYGPGPGGPPRGDIKVPPGGRHTGRPGPPPNEYNDDAPGHASARRRRRYDDHHDDNVKSSTMAGLTGVGTGMARVSEWVGHIPPGATPSAPPTLMQ